MDEVRSVKAFMVAVVMLLMFYSKAMSGENLASEYQKVGQQIAPEDKYNQIPEEIFVNSFINQFEDKNHALSAWNNGAGQIFEMIYSKLYLSNSLEIHSKWAGEAIKKTKELKPNIDPQILSYIALNGFIPPENWGTERGSVVLTGLIKDEVKGVTTFTKDAIGNPLVGGGLVRNTQIGGEFWGKEDILILKIPSLNHSNLVALITDILSSKVQDYKKPIILDLRGSEGGLIFNIKNILELFLPFTDDLFYTKTSGNMNRFKSKYSANLVFSEQLLVLIDENTSGASLMIAASLQDNKRATIAGHIILKPLALISTLSPVDKTYCPNRNEQCAVNIPTGELIRPSQASLSEGVFPDIEVNWEKPNAMNDVISIWLDKD